MDDYGEYQDGSLQPETMPSTLVKEMPTYLKEPYEDLDEGISKLKNRLEQCVQFVEFTASSGVCRCSYYKDPNCVVCMANKLLSEWQTEES